MTPLNKLSLDRISSISENRWLATTRKHKQYLIDSNGKVEQIKSPFDDAVITVEMYDRSSKSWAVGVFQGRNFSPFWREKEKIKRRSDYTHLSEKSNVRRGDHIIFTASQVISLYHDSIFLPSRILRQLQDARKKTSKEVMFLDLENGYMVSLTCPMNISELALSEDGLTAIVSGYKGFVIIDNPLF